MTVTFLTCIWWFLCGQNWKEVAIQTVKDKKSGKAVLRPMLEKWTYIFKRLKHLKIHLWRQIYAFWISLSSPPLLWKVAHWPLCMLFPAERSGSRGFRQERGFKSLYHFTSLLVHTGSHQNCASPLAGNCPRTVREKGVCEKGEEDPVQAITTVSTSSGSLLIAPLPALLCPLSPLPSMLWWV